MAKRRFEKNVETNQRSVLRMKRGNFKESPTWALAYPPSMTSGPSPLAASPNLRRFYVQASFKWAKPIHVFLSQP